MVMALHHSWRQALLALMACLPLMALAQQQQNEVAFIELSASEDEVYVHQQLRLTVKLYYTNQVIQGQLSEPEHPDAVIDELNEQKQYRELVAGERYRVIERDYVIFPRNPAACSCRRWIFRAPPGIPGATITASRIRRCCSRLT